MDRTLGDPAEVTKLTRTWPDIERAKDHRIKSPKVAAEHYTRHTSLTQKATEKNNL